MENPAFPANPSLCPEVLALLEDSPRGFRPSRARQAALMEEALRELDRFGPLLELRLGQVLAPMIRGGHKHLGYVTPAVFCREELGISATAAWDSVRLAEGLLRRPILRQAFLEQGLPRTHALELLRLDEAGDAEWAARAAGLPVQELRRALKPLRSSMSGEEKEKARVRTFDLEAEPYATWLAAVELARRREGRDLGLAHVLEDGESWRVYCDDRLVDGEALAWEGDEAETLEPETLDVEHPRADDRVCEATPEYRCGPASLESETLAA